MDVYVLIYNYYNVFITMMTYLSAAGRTVSLSCGGEFKPSDGKTLPICGAGVSRTMTMAGMEK